jgi:hypothetical protein
VLSLSILGFGLRIVVILDDTDEFFGIQEGLKNVGTVSRRIAKIFRRDRMRGETVITGYFMISPVISSK